MLPTKEQFIKIMKKIQDATEYDHECLIAARKHGMEFSEVDTSSLGYVATDLLDMMFNCYYPDGMGDVSYFCYELDFGKEWKPGMVEEQDENGNMVDVDMSSAEKLYDYLVSREVNNG